MNKPTNHFHYVMGAFVAAILLHVALLIAAKWQTEARLKAVSAQFPQPPEQK